MCFYIVFIRSRRSFFCSSDREFHLEKSFRCSSVSEFGSLPSEKNCAKVIPKALQTAIEKNMEQRQVLTNLMASGYLEPALFNKESNALAAETDVLRQEKDGLMHSINGDKVKVEELQRLMKFVSKEAMLTEFDDAVFLSFVEKVTVWTRTEVSFELKCGLSLRERLVEA